jgi:tetratricopeptide (TPR) repeat protein
VTWAPEFGAFQYFKPDNAMIGADGRARVLDFGLSRSYVPDEPTAASSSGGALQLLVTAAGSMIGTPAYMSPEQFRREEADARSDQFSFCVAVREALYGVRPFAGKSVHELSTRVRAGEIVAPPAGARVPAWIRRVLERGLAVDPKLRWPGMDVLLAALSHDPVRARRRWLAGAASVMAIASAGYGAALYGSAQAEVCSGAADELIGVWDGERREAVEQAVRATGVAYAARAEEAMVRHLDEYAASWSAVHAASCTAHQRGHMSPLLFDRRMACLRQRKSELAGTVAVLGQTTRDSVAQAVDAVRGLPALALCEDDERLQAAVAPAEDPGVAAAVEDGRARLARLQALERSGRHAEALADVALLAGEADALGYLPYQAEVHLLAGKVFMLAVKPEARGHFETALQAGLATRLDALVAEALILQMFQLGVVERRPAEALIMEPLGWGFLRRVGEPPRLVALMHNSVGGVYYSLGQRERASAAWEAGLAVLAAHAPDDPLRWALLQNLAMALGELGQHARAGELVRASIPQLEAQLGRCHPMPAIMQYIVGKSDAALGRTDAAARSFAAGITCLRAAYPTYAIMGLEDLGEMYLQLGDTGQVRLQLVAATQLLALSSEASPWGLEIELLRADLDVAEGRLADARRSLAALRVRAIEVVGATSDLLAGVDVRLGLVAHLERDDAAALDHLMRAEKALGPGYRSQERGLYAFTLARVLRALGREPERAKALANEAIAAYATAGALSARKVAEIQAWQAAAG